MSQSKDERNTQRAKDAIKEKAATVMEGLQETTQTVKEGSDAVLDTAKEDHKREDQRNVSDSKTQCWW